MACLPPDLESGESDFGDEMVFSFSTPACSINEENSNSFTPSCEGGDNSHCKNARELTSEQNSLAASQNLSVQSSLATFDLTNSIIPVKRLCIDKSSSEPLDDLRVAVMQGNLAATSSLLEKGMWVDSILKAGWTALMYACSCGHRKIVRYLLEQKADPNFHKDKFTPLMAACASSKDDEEELLCCVNLLIESGSHINDRERYHTTALIFAARDGRTNIVKTLLQNGAEINKEDSRGRTALCWAASGGHGLVIRLLLDAGADPTHISNSGKSPVDYAYNHSHTETGEILQNAADNWKEKRNNHPLKSRLANSKNFTVSDKRLTTKYHVTTYGDLELFLTGLNLPDLIPIFQEHQLTFHDLLVITEEELNKLGIDKLGVKKRILEGVHASHKKNWLKSSLPQMKQNNMSCPDAVSIMANIAKHLNYIEGTVVYMRHQIQAQPRILELGQETSNVYNLIQKTEEGIKNIRLLYDEMRFFKLYLDKIQDNVEFVAADLIVETVPSSERYNKYNRRTVLVMIVVTAVLGGLMWKKSVVTQAFHNMAFKSFFSL